MKKLFLYVFLGLLFCNVSFAKVLNFKCDELLHISSDGEKYNYRDVMLLQIDTSKKEMREYSDTNRAFLFKWKITEINEYSYISNELTDDTNGTEDMWSSAAFNRWTGEYETEPNKKWGFSRYSCKPISKQLY